MMVSVETYLRRGRRSLQRLLLDPRAGGLVRGAACWGGGCVLSAASLLGAPQPLAMGLICAARGTQALLMTLGAVMGYPFFWSQAGAQGIVWSAVGCVLAWMLGGREEGRPLMIPALAAMLTAVTGLTFQVFLRVRDPVELFALRLVLAGLSAALFAQAYACRDAVTDWLIGAVGVLALAQVAPVSWLSLGYVAGGLMAVAGAFPEAALAGLALDLSGITGIPMTAVLCLAWMARMIPFLKTWQRCAAPAGACLLVMAVCGHRDTAPLAGLVLGGSLGALIPPRREAARRRGETGLAQVRLELGAQMLSSVQQLLLEREPVPIDREALLDKVRQRACAGCSARSACRQREALGPQLLEQPLDADCRKAGRLIPELRRAQERLRDLQVQRAKLEEYRRALIQQYQFLGEYLRGLSDRLARRGEAGPAEFRVEVSARSRGRERANGDRCLAFPGPDLRYYVLLCDGMGTGLGAAQDGQTGAELLRKMLAAGFPAEHALRSLNSFLTLGGEAGAVTADLAELRLDTGLAAVYKWGAAPSYVLTRSGAEKIGTASPPPGISVSETRETVQKLSLRRGEVLILLSDGVDGEDVQRLSDLTPDAPPGELAAKILEFGRGRTEDDATAAVIRLRPAGLEPS